MTKQNPNISEVLHYFEQISAIPRMSGKEEKIADYLCEFAKTQGLKFLRDAQNNVLIGKAASAGYENSPAVMLQGHTDMVCEKRADSAHDFETDPIELVFLGDEIMANGTTLGADNGIAVAIILAILASKELCHPAIEALFTSAEEVGLIGADAFDYSVCKAAYLINLDSEDEGYGCVSCSGGMRTDITIPAAREPKSEGAKVYTLRISGLMGGHSGTDINLGRANASKLIGRLLYTLYKDCNIKLCAVSGGTKDNAISACAYAEFVSDADIDTLRRAVSKVKLAIESELVNEDRNAKIELSCMGEHENCMSSADTKKIISLLSLSPQGVIRQSRDIEGLVESSVNLGVLGSDAKSVHLGFSMRSPLRSMIDETARNLHVLADTFGANAHDYAYYPGWNYEKDTVIEKIYRESYRELFGSEPKIYAIHAGLECGVLKSHMPSIEAISIGPTLKNVHSPSESLNVPSIGRLWDTLVLMLKKLK